MRARAFVTPKDVPIAQLVKKHRCKFLGKKGEFLFSFCLAAVLWLVTEHVHQHTNVAFFVRTRKTNFEMLYFFVILQALSRQH